MRIDEIIAADDEPVFSFEFFPPKTEEGERNLYEALEALRALEPAFVSVTWGGAARRARRRSRSSAHPRDARARGDGALHLRRRDR